MAISNLTGEVALLGRSLDVGGGLDHGDVEVLALAAAAVHLGEPHGGRVLDGATRLAPVLVHRRRAHRRRRPDGSLFPLCCPFGGTSRRGRRGSWLAGGRILLLKNARSSECRDVRGCSCVPIPSNASAAEPIKSKRRAFLPAGDRGRPRDAISFDEFLLAVAGCRQSAGPQWSFRRRILNRGMHLRV